MQYLDRLTVAELDEGSRMLKADLVSAITEKTEKRWAALGIAVYLVRRRDDRTLTLDKVRDLTPPALLAIVDEAEAGDDEADSPTEPVPA